MKKDRFLFFCGVWMLLLFAGINTSYAQEAYGYIFPHSSIEYLTDQDVAGLPVQVLCYAKNEIYARNGRTFLSEELQGYFDLQYWYCPSYSPEQFSDDMLNPIEQANVAILSETESVFGGYTLDAPGYSYDPVYGYLSDNSDYSGDYDVDPDSYIFYDSDSRLLSSDELQDLSLQELCFARNEIYARHGRGFNSTELSDYFNQKNWYWCLYNPEDFDETLLNEIETENAALLKNTEYSQSPSGYILDQPGYSYSAIRSFFGGTTNAAPESDYIIWDSNIRYLTQEDVQDFSLQQLNYARNEIYARRGYIFQSQELRDYFGSRSWYKGTVSSSAFSADVFNEYEMANIELLKKMEYQLNPDGYLLY